MEIRGKVVLEIDYVRSIFTLDMSGTIRLYKIGNIASGAGRFILDASNSFSSVPQFWGVLKFQTNFAFLEPYGVYLYGSAMLQINATGETKVETLTLEGIPGDVIHTIDNASTVSSLKTQLPDGMFQDNALSAGWVTQLENIIQDFDETKAVITEVVENLRWRVTYEGKQYFIDVNDDTIDIRGEERTYELGPYMFAVEIAGMLAIRPAGVNIFEMSGGFYLKIGVEGFEIFAMAELSFFGITYSEVTGLLIVSTGVGGGIPGVAGHFSISAGVSLADLGLPDIDESLFSISGKISVVFNTTLVDQTFDVPDSFLPMLDEGDPTHIVISKSTPLADGSFNPNASAEIYIKAVVEAEVLLFNVIRLTGYLGISAGAGQEGVSFIIEGAVSCEIDFLGALSGTLFFEVFIGAEPGIVGRVQLVLASEGILPGIDLHGEFILEFSTYATTYTAYTFGINQDGTLKRDGNDNLILEDTDIEPGLMLYMAGYLNIADILKLEGKFSFTIDPIGGVLDIYAEASISLDPIGSFDVIGWLHIDGQGLTALIDISLDVGFGEDIGISFEASAHLELNTTSTSQTVPFSDGNGETLVIQPGFRLHIEGSIDFLGFAKGSGYVDVQITVNGIQLMFGVDFYLFGLSFGAHGGAGIYTGVEDGAPGMALFLDVYVLADAEIFSIEAAGKISLNTTSIERMGIDAESFTLVLDGYVEILGVLKFDAGFSIQVGGDIDGDGIADAGEWRFAFHAGIDFFGIMTMQGSGFLDSFGNFDITLDAYMQIGPNGFCIKGSFHFRIYSTATNDGTGNMLYSLGLEMGASVKAVVFGITLAGISLDASISVSGYGRQPIVLAVTVKIKILFVKISKTAKFNIGYLMLPKPIFLGGYQNDPQTWDEAGGDLYLNMGSRGTDRYMASDAYLALDEQEEGFTIEQIDGNENGGTLKVTAFGRTRTYQNVTSLHADGGTGDDQIIIMDNVKIPVYINGGSGDDMIINKGSGTSVIDGGSGEDYIESWGNGANILNGGEGSDYIIYAGSGTATIHGGGGNDMIFGGAGNDYIYGDAGDDEINSGGGLDHIYGGAGSDLIKVGFNGLGSVVDGQSGYDYIHITATAADEDFLVYGSGANLKVEGIGQGTLTASNTEELILDAGAGSDNILISNLRGTPINKVTINMGQIVVDTGQTTIEMIDLDDDPNTTDDQFETEVPVYNIYDDGAADTLTIEGYDDANDSFIASSTGQSQSTNEMQSVSIIHGGVSDYLVHNSVRSEGDKIIIRAKAGNDLIDFSGLGDNDTSDSVTYPDLVAVEMYGGTGNDRLIGTPFNDVLDGGYGDDRFTGGYGYDIFADEGGYDTLVEIQDRDMSLFDNKFISGTILGDNGGDFFREVLEDINTIADYFNLDNPDLNHPDTGDRYASSAIVENLDYIFEEASITGGDGNNILVVNDIDNSVRVGSGTISVVAWSGVVTLDNRGNEADTASEYYIINAKGTTGARIVIEDTGGGSGTDRLTINGTNQGDIFTLNGVGAGNYRTGIVVAGELTSADREVITFRGIERVAVNTRSGNDRVLSDDTVAITIVNLGAGDDEIVIGTVPLIPDTGNRTLEYPEGVPVADTDNMTSGNSSPLFVLGEGQNDRFEVNHNVSRLYLHGGNGNDRFLLKTFLVLMDQARPNEIANLMSVFGGAGMNRYDYLQNAPVEINGGPGIDTIVVIGTPIGDTFVVTDKYIAGAGRITTFKNIEVIEVDAAGGNDIIYILSTSADFETTVIGGSGDDTIHLGGEHPPIVFDPPAFIYTPPSFITQLPPEVVYTDYDISFDGIRFDIGLWEFLAYGSNPDAVVQGLINNIIASWDNSFEHFRVNSSSFSGVSWSLRYDWFWWWLNPTVEIRVADFDISFGIGHLETREKVVQPPPVIVDPEPFLFKAPGSFDISDIKGKLTIVGGDQYETDGDTVIVHNQDGSSDDGLLTNRISERMIQVGEDQDGNFIFVQDRDASTGDLIFDTYQSLEGIGLPVGDGLDEVRYFGVRLYGFEAIDIRLSDGDDNFTIAAAEYHKYDGTNDNVTIGTALEDVMLTIAAGGGNDIINVKQIGSETRILGGAGNDIVYVNDNNELNGINAKLLYDGNGHIDEQLQHVDAAEYVDILNDVPMVFVNTVPHSNLFYDDPATGDPIYYELPEQAPIIADDGTGKLLIRIAVIGPDGEIVEDRVQEYGLQELGVQMKGIQKTINSQLVYLDENGNDTLTDTGVPVIIQNNAGQLVYLDEDGNMTFNDTGIAIIITNPTGSLVYLDEKGRKTFSSTGVISFITDFDNGDPLYISADGIKVDVLPTTLVIDAPGVDFNIYETYGSPEFGSITVQVSQDGTTYYTVTPSAGLVRIAGDEGRSSDLIRSYDLDGCGISWARYIKITGTDASGEYPGFDLDTVGVIPGHGGPDTPNFLSYIAANNTGSGNSIIAGAPDSEFISLGNGGTVVYKLNVNDMPSLITVTRTEEVDFLRSVEVYTTIAGTDYLYVNNSNDSSDVHSILDTYYLPIAQYDADGQIVYHDDSTSPDAKFFFGGEQKRDPISGDLLYYDVNPQADPYTGSDYKAGDVVRDPFTSQVVLDPFGNPLLHKAGDPLIHIAGERVLHFTDEVRRYLGGEQVYDEQGDPVYNGDGSAFLHQPGQAMIYDRRDPVEAEDGTHLQYIGGEPRYYLGDEVVQVGDPMTDYSGNLLLDENGHVMRYSALNVTDVYGQDILHKRGAPVYKLVATGADPNLSLNWGQDTHTAGEYRYYLGNEPKLYFGGEEAFYTADDQITSSELFNRIQVVGLNGETAMPGQLFYTGLDEVYLTLGDGNDIVTIVKTHAGTTAITTGAGDDTINVQDIDGETTIYSNSGADEFNVGSFAGLWDTSRYMGEDTYELLNVNGYVDFINDWLNVYGGTEDDVLNVDDTGDTFDNSGILTNSRLTGLNMTDGINYHEFEALNMDLGSGNDILNIRSTHAGLTTVEMLAGNDIVNVGSNAPVEAGNVNDIAGLLVIDAGTNDTGFVDQINVDDSTDTADNFGQLTSDRLTGLGMGYADNFSELALDDPTHGITYQAFEDMNIVLGSGNDELYIDSTHAGTTAIYTGDELPDGDNINDIVNIYAIDGVTTINGGYGNDMMRVNYDRNGDQTYLNEIVAELTLHGLGDSDTYEIGLAGTGNSRINVYDDSPVDDLGVDRLHIFGTDLADLFLMRPNAVSSLELDADREPLEGGGIERINYDDHINGDLSIYGREGNDTFVLDDTSSSITIYGDAGDDTFQVGQIFQSPRNEQAGLVAEDTFDTTLTTRGYLSNGVSHSTILYGGIGNDNFTVYRNLADLWLYGDEDDDTFRVRAFVKVDPNDTKAPMTNINGGQGADFISYTVNAPVHIEGGDGFDTVTVVGTEFGDDFVVTSSGVFGAGLFVQYNGVERVIVDALEGNDTFFVESTSESVSLEIIGGLGSDTFNVGGGDSDKPITVVSNDLQGHSGLVMHQVAGDDPDYQGVFAEWISANVADNDEAGIVISLIDGSLRLFEDTSAPSVFVQGTYAVVLTRSPEESVRVTATPTLPRESEQNAGGEGVQLNGSSQGVTLLFDRTNWFIPQIVTVTAPDDILAEGIRVINIQHSVIEGAVGDDGGEYDQLAVSSLPVEVIDNDTARVVIVGTGDDNLVAEMGAFAETDSYYVVLTRMPHDNVMIDIATDGQTTFADGLTTMTLTFTAGNWFTPQVVTVKANEDIQVEGIHYSRITHTISVQTDVDDYYGLTLEDVTVGLTAEVVSDLNAGFDVQIDSSGNMVISQIDGSAFSAQITGGSIINKTLASKEVEVALSGTVAESETWIITLNGTNYGYEVKSGDILDTVVDELTQLIDSQSRYAAALSGTTITIEISDGTGFIAEFSISDPASAGTGDITVTDTSEDYYLLITVALSGAVADGGVFTLNLNGQDYIYIVGANGETTNLDIIDVTVSDDEAAGVIVRQTGGSTNVTEPTDLVRLGFGQITDVSIQNGSAVIIDAGPLQALTITFSIQDPPNLNTLSKGRATISGQAVWTIANIALSGEVVAGDVWAMNINDNIYSYEVGTGGYAATMSGLLQGLSAAIPSVYSPTINYPDDTITLSSTAGFTALTVSGSAAITGTSAWKQAIVALSGTIRVGEIWTIKVNGKSYSHTVTATDDLVKIAQAFATKINADTAAAYTATSKELSQFVGDFGVAILYETNYNDSLFTAQTLDFAGWSVATSPDILNSTTVPHITIKGTGDGEADYYQFTIDIDMLNAGGGHVGMMLDIDHGYEFGDNIFWGSQLKLYLLADDADEDATPQLIASGWGYSNPDTTCATGRETWLDDFLT